MPLCSTCDAFDLASLLDWDREIHDLVLHKSISTLIINIASCDLCRLLWTLLTERAENGSELVTLANNGDPLAFPVVLRGRQYFDDDWEPGGVYQAKIRCDRFRFEGCLSFYSADGNDDTLLHFENIILGRRIKAPTEQFALLNEWARECDENHLGCRRDPGPLPTRVIDVGRDGESEPRLVATDGKAGRYMTLSHCWGLHPVIQTTSRTLESHLEALPLSKLPNTFKDAVLVTRAMGIQYLWIDSLCIIQDSKEDWERESAKMGSIYFSSYLTIAASGSSDSRGGCFVARDTSSHVELKCSDPDRETPLRIMARPQPGDFTHLPKRTLHTRAWVLQEKILSARMINFDVDQLLWQCQERQLTEDGIPPEWEHQGTVNTTIQDDLNLSHPFARDLGNVSSFEADWYGMITRYAERGITKSFDKLPALSGLAKAMEERTQVEYVAGLWKKNLAHGLLWGRMGPWLSAPADGYRAPSWSWASLEGGITTVIGGQIGYDTFESVVEDIETTIKPRGLDPRGMIDSGRLTLSGRIRTFDRRQNPRDAGYFHVEEVNSLRKGAVTDYLLDNGEIVGQVDFDEAFKANDHMLYCLQVVRRKVNHSSWHGIILEPTGKDKEFKRIGRCFTEYVHNPMWFENVPVDRITII